MKTPRSSVLRGAIAGLFGAAALALWFLIVDTIRGTPFATPGFLAGIVLGRGAIDMSAAAIGLYTLVHAAVFVVVGVVVAIAVDRFGLRPHFLLGLVLGFLLFDLTFYIGLIATGVNVLRALGWPAVLTGNVLAGLALFGYLHAAGPAHGAARAGLFASRLLREGVVAGLVGAVAVAAWFLVLDGVQGRVLFTPAALGSALFLGASGPADVSITTPIVAGYTALHVAAFILVGLLGAALMRGAEREPHVLLGAVLLFVTLEAFVIGMIAIAAVWLLDVIAWWMIAAANLIAALGMGTYLWREHPRLHEEIRRADLHEAAL
jgi:hypothetical protein